MKFNKCLLRYLIFGTLLIISEAGRSWNPTTNSQGSRPINPVTNTGGSNTGRVNPSGANSGRAPAWGVPRPSMTPVQPRPQTSTASTWRPQTFGSRPQAPEIPSGFRPQNSGAPIPKIPAFPTLPRPQIPGQFPPSVPINQGPSSPMNNHFPALGRPKLTYAETELQRQQQMMKSPSSSSLASSGSTSLHSLPGSSSGYGSSETQSSPFVQNPAANSGNQIPIPSPNKCVDNYKIIPPKIASAENCFDYFKLAITWSPCKIYQEFLRFGEEMPPSIWDPEWVIHGLWPSRNDNQDLNCNREDIKFKKGGPVIEKLERRLNQVWYAIINRNRHSNENFWAHEFNSHGSCATRSTSIRDEVSYFEKAIDLFDKLSLSETLANEGYKPGAVTKLETILDAIQKKINKKVQVNYLKNYNTGENYLKEVIVCYDLYLNYIDCPRRPLAKYTLETDIKYVDQLT